MAPPWLNPPRTMLSSGMPASTSSWMSLSTALSVAWIPALSSSRATDRSKLLTSNHPGMTWPPFTVMGISGACGRTHLTCASCGHSILATGSQPCPLSPRPCRKMTVALCRPEGMTLRCLSADMGAGGLGWAGVYR